MENMEQGLNVEDAVKRLLNAGERKEGESSGADAKEVADSTATPERTGLADEEQVIDLAMIKTDPEKLYPLIYYAIKRKLKEWEQSMAERPGKFLPFDLSKLRTKTAHITHGDTIDHIKHSAQGKRAAVTQVQSGEYLKPLFKLLRSRVRNCLSVYCSLLTALFRCRTFLRTC